MDERLNIYLGELIKRLAEGDASTLEDIYKITYRILYAVGNSYYRQKEDVEDAIQELLIKIYDNAKRFRQNKNACAWIIKIYHNVIITNLRKRKRERFVDVDVYSDSFAKSTVDEEYIERHAFLSEIFDKIKKYEKELIIYRYWCGFTVREVAKILHKSKSSVQRDLEKVKEKIKNLK